MFKIDCVIIDKEYRLINTYVEILSISSDNTYIAKIKTKDAFGNNIIYRNDIVKIINLGKQNINDYVIEIEFDGYSKEYYNHTRLCIFELRTFNNIELNTKIKCLVKGG